MLGRPCGAEACVVHGHTALRVVRWLIWPSAWQAWACGACSLCTSCSSCCTRATATWSAPSSSAACSTFSSSSSSSASLCLRFLSCAGGGRARGSHTMATRVLCTRPRHTAQHHGIIVRLPVYVCTDCDGLGLGLAVTALLYDCATVRLYVIHIYMWRLICGPRTPGSSSTACSTTPWWTWCSSVFTRTTRRACAPRSALPPRSHALQLAPAALSAFLLPRRASRRTLCALSAR